MNRGESVENTAIAEEKVIDGKELDSLNIPYNYAQCATVFVGNVSYRVEANILLACLNEFRFKVKKKKVHSYLDIAEYPPLDDVTY